MSPPCCLRGVRISTRAFHFWGTQMFRPQHHPTKFRRQPCNTELIPSLLYSFKITMPAGARSDPRGLEMNTLWFPPQRVHSLTREGERDGNIHYCTISVTNVTRGTFMKCHRELRGGSQERLPRPGSTNCPPGPTHASGKWARTPLCLNIWSAGICQ